MSEYQCSSKLKAKTAKAWEAALAGHLYPGEVVWAFAKANQLKPMIDGVAITNARVLGIYGNDLAGRGPKVAVGADEITSFGVVKKRTGGKVLTVSTRERGEITFGMVPGDDIDFVTYFIQQLASAGYPQEVRAVAEAGDSERVQAEQIQRDGRHQVRTVGSKLSDKEWRTLRAHSAGTEMPWLVINSGVGAGFLAAFDDRLIIAKISGAASLMAGSFGGGRVTTFTYSDITNVEYNGGMISGVLEVLTASYQGSANHDYWRSAGKGRNAAADDPWTLSNCLPLTRSVHKQALPALVELQSKIVESKQATTSAHAIRNESPAPGGRDGLSKELRDLAQLHDQGVLDAAEFAAAKQAAIAKYSG